MGDNRARDLGHVESFLRRKNADLPNLRLIGQAHYASRGFAFIVVLGVDDDTSRRRAIRSGATELLQALGHDVHLKAGYDVYELDPERPRSKHEEFKILSNLQSRFR